MKVAIEIFHFLIRWNGINHSGNEQFAHVIVINISYFLQLLRNNF